MRPGSARRARQELFWHALHGVTLRVDDREVDCWVYHGPPRVGRDETLVEAERVAEARLAAAEVAGQDPTRCAWCARTGTGCPQTGLRTGRTGIRTR
jgi:hypothetical protein